MAAILAEDSATNLTKIYGIDEMEWFITMSVTRQIRLADKTRGIGIFYTDN